MNIFQQFQLKLTQCGGQVLMAEVAAWGILLWALVLCGCVLYGCYFVHQCVTDPTNPKEKTLSLDERIHEHEIAETERKLLSTLSLKNDLLRDRHCVDGHLCTRSLGGWQQVTDEWYVVQVVEYDLGYHCWFHFVHIHKGFVSKSRNGDDALRYGWSADADSETIYLTIYGRHYGQSYTQKFGYATLGLW